MTKVSDALALLDSDVPHERLKGGRYFGSHREPNVLPKLKEYLQLERVGFVKKALELAIKHQGTADLASIEEDRKNNPVDDGTDWTGLRQQIHAKAVDHVAGALLHEIEPKIGMLKVVAARELEGYEDSELKKYIESLDRSVIGITDLRRASATPRAAEFDLSQTVKDIIVEESPGREEIFYYHGPQPFVIIGDQTLLALAISNGIRNAIEAVSVNQISARSSIVVEWGETDIDYCLTSAPMGQTSGIA